jgi:3-methyladenine DNA glycosylase AlkD
MPKHKVTPRYIADHIRRVLKDGGSAPHAEGVQKFFKNEIQTRGWRTAEMRKVANRFRHAISEDMGKDFLVQVADQLFRGPMLEEKVFAVLLLEKITSQFGDSEFVLFESWLDRITSWADHDGLVHYLIGPMVVESPARKGYPFRWAKSSKRWQRRAACVAFIQGTRKKLFFSEVMRLSNRLLADDDDMVQKGLGWLLRETAKADPKRTLPYLMTIRSRAPRLVLRTACETLTPAQRKKILST